MNTEREWASGTEEWKDTLLYWLISLLRIVV